MEPTCRQSLANLGLDYIDLYLMHWPVAFKEGPEYVPMGPDGKVQYSDVDIVDTYKAMEKLVEKKLVRSIGLSNFNSVQLARILDNCSIKPVVNQVPLCHSQSTCTLAEVLKTGAKSSSTPLRNGISSRHRIAL